MTGSFDRLHLPKARRVPSTVVRIVFHGVGDIGALDESLRLVDELRAIVDAVASSKSGFAFRFDLADFVLAIPEDENPESRSSGCRAALELCAKIATEISPVGGEARNAPRVRAFAGIDYGPLLWMPSLGNPGLGAVVSGASRLARLAEKHGLQILISAPVIEGADASLEVTKFRELDGQTVYKLTYLGAG